MNEINKIGKNMIASSISKNRQSRESVSKKDHKGTELVSIAERTLRDGKFNIDPKSRNGQALVTLALKAFLMNENDRA